MDKWESLLAQLQVSEGSESFCREEDLLSFEAESGIVLPIGYKEFCKVFDSGEIRKFFRISCPCSIKSRADIREIYAFNIQCLKDQVQFEKESRSMGHPALSADKIEFLERLLGKAFAFGSSSSADTFLWDLSTYSELDKSYDIYRASIDDLEHTFLVGRDFFEFIQNFCLGTESNRILPKALRKRNVDKSFSRYAKVLEITRLLR